MKQQSFTFRLPADCRPSVGVFGDAVLIAARSSFEPSGPVRVARGVPDALLVVVEALATKRDPKAEVAVFYSGADGVQRMQSRPFGSGVDCVQWRGPR